MEKVYPFEQALAAVEKTETRHARGKVVVLGPEHTVGTAADGHPA